MSRSQLVWVSLILIGLCALYLPGLQNELIFDDVPLLGGRTLWEDYGGLFQLKQRLLSYGSFVWIEALFGAGWWKQRLVNLLLHFSVVLALYGLFKALTASVRWPEELARSEAFDSSRLAAVRVGVAVFAFNPVAVYAVAYLIQRSILAATLLGVLSCLAFVRALQTGRPALLGAALASYLVALLCKEHALMVPALWVPLYIFLRRPGAKQIAFVVAGSAALVGGAIAALLTIYGHIIGVPFDELSRIYLDQLEAIDTTIGQRLWPLSVLNQAALFFHYGLLWFIPNVGWMSIDMRPPFPVSFLSWPHLLGAVGYVASLLGFSWLVVRRSDAAGFAGLCVLMALLLFGTEFAVVWVQDPFVLYRSYLWGIAVPGLVALMLVGMRPATIYTAGLVLALVLGGLALERVLSLQHKLGVWSDAVAKLDADASPNAVGRWRPYINRGNYYLESLLPELAYRDFARAIELGEVRGHSNYHMAISLQLSGRYREAVEQFDEAEARGMTQMAALYVNRAESRLALGDAPPAYDDLTKALVLPMNDELRRQTRTKLARLAVGVGKYDVAWATYAELLTSDPGNDELKLGVALAEVGLGRSESALARLDKLAPGAKDPSVFYGRALALRQLGRTREAYEEAGRAVALDSGNPVFRDLRRQLAGQLE